MSLRVMLGITVIQLIGNEVKMCEDYGVSNHIAFLVFETQFPKHLQHVFDNYDRMKYGYDVLIKF